MTFLAVRRPDNQVEVVLQKVRPGLSVHTRVTLSEAPSLTVTVVVSASPVSSAVASSRNWTESLNVAAISTRPKPSELFGISPAPDATYGPLHHAPLINMALTKAALELVVDVLQRGIPAPTRRNRQ